MSGETRDGSDREWDLFVSYAGEDRYAFVKPLVELLNKFGVRVWWDGFELRIGDSLSRAIDAGLAASQFGAVVISPSFLKKRWPEYELRGLTAREMVGDKVILPIWYGVSLEDVLRYSPSLADKKAASLPIGGTGENELVLLAVSLIEVVRPDLFTRIHRRLGRLIAERRAPVETVPTSDLLLGPVRHESLPAELYGRVRLIRAALMVPYPQSMQFWVDGFLRDAHPSREIAAWERIATAYLEFIQYQRVDMGDHEALFGFLLDILLEEPMRSMSLSFRVDFGNTPNSWPHLWYRTSR